MAWAFLLSSAVLASLSWTLISVLLNYNAARKIALPIVISPVSPLNPLWILICRAFPIVLSLKTLPFGLGTWARCTYMGWAFQEKHALHDELGPVFVVVTPGGNEVTVADPQAAHTILSRRKEFIKPAVMYGTNIKSVNAEPSVDICTEQLNVFGRNLNTVRIRPDPSCKSLR